MTRAAFLDRDGVLNVDHGYIGSVERLELVPGAADAVRRLNQAGFFVAIVTNQSGIGRGMFDEKDYRMVMDHLLHQISLKGGRIDDTRYCPFHPEAKVPEYRVANHPWRKPNPGMILDLIGTHDLDRNGSFLIGDSPSDMKAAEAAGIEGYLFKGGSSATPQRLDEFLDTIL